MPPPETATKPAAPVAARPGRPVSLAKRAAMLDAAIAEFTEFGFDAASVDAIAARAEVSKRTLYNHFHSKEALFGVLVKEVALRIRQHTNIEYDAREPLREQLLRFAQGSRRLNEAPDNVKLLRAVVAEHLRHPQRVDPLLAQFSSTEYGFASWVAAACRDGRLHGDPARMSHVMGSFMRSIMFWPALLGRSDSHRATVDAEIAESIDMFLLYYTRPRRA